MNIPLLLLYGIRACLFSKEPIQTLITNSFIYFNQLLREPSNPKNGIQIYCPNHKCYLFSNQINFQQFLQCGVNRLNQRWLVSNLIPSSRSQAFIPHISYQTKMVKNRTYNSFHGSSKIKSSSSRFLGAIRKPFNLLPPLLLLPDMPRNDWNLVLQVLHVPE